MHATAVTSSDCLIRSLNLPFGMRIAARLAVGMTKPRRRVLGMAVAGEIDAVGMDVSRFAEGDQVFGFDVSPSAVMPSTSAWRKAASWRPCRPA
jgi:NADPH:quinone reductase-like Zn-dependent oxidoreductase